VRRGLVAGFTRTLGTGRWPNLAWRFDGRAMTPSWSRVSVSSVRRLNPAAFDVLLAAVVLAVSLGLAATAGRHQPGTRPVDGLAYALTGISCGLLSVRRRWPLPPTAVVGAALLLFSLRGYPGGALILPVTIALYTVGTAIERTRALLVGAAATAVVVVRAWMMPAGQTYAFTWTPSGWVLAALVWGVAVRARRQTIEALRDRAEAAERSREQEAARRVAEERLRIARDLHDVIGHSFVTANVQARLAATVMDSEPDRAREALAAIQTTSRDALREIRQALSVLRSTTSPTAAAGLDELKHLLEPLRAAGLTVNTTIESKGDDLPVVVATGVYRIVQEALTNVLKHAAARHVSVRILRDGRSVMVEVIDDGTGVTPGEGGHGLEGMAERATALGGRLEAGPRLGGGFAVTARIPVTG
jgi:signal transduction histidine kinase